MAYETLRLALVSLLLAGSTVRGLECFCEDRNMGETSLNDGCLSNKTCIVRDSRRGQCYVETYNNKEGIRYGCWDMYLSEDFATEELCNKTSEERRIHCCNNGNHCNEDVSFLDPDAAASPTQLVTSSHLDYETTSTGSQVDDTNWTVGTLMTAIVFVMILVITVTIFAISFVILRRRATQIRLQQLHHNII